MTNLIDDDEILRRAGLPLRCVILEDGLQVTNGNRDKEYGTPYNNLTDTATLFSAYLHAKYGGDVVDPMQLNLTAEDVAWLNVLQKISRTFSGNIKQDTYTDAATYAAIAGECAFYEREN